MCTSICAVCKLRYMWSVCTSLYAVCVHTSVCAADIYLYTCNVSISLYGYRVYTSECVVCVYLFMCSVYTTLLWYSSIYLYTCNVCKHIYKCSVYIPVYKQCVYTAIRAVRKHFTRFSHNLISYYRLYHQQNLSFLHGLEYLLCPCFFCAPPVWNPQDLMILGIWAENLPEGLVMSVKIRLRIPWVLLDVFCVILLLQFEFFSILFKTSSMVKSLSSKSSACPPYKILPPAICHWSSPYSDRLSFSVLVSLPACLSLEAICPCSLCRWNCLLML